MIRRSLIAVTTLAALGVSSGAFATVSATATNVTANQQDAAIPITYTTRAGIAAAGFDANLVDGGSIIVDGSEVFQVFDALSAAFVDCDGNQQTVASQTTIACSPSGVYSISKNNNTDLQTLTNAMRVLVDVVPAAANGGTATVEFGPYCTGVQTPAANGCTAFFLLNSNRDDAAAAPVANNGTITVQGAVLNPPTINFNPTSVTLSTGQVGQQSPASIIAVTATGGAAPDTGSYTCTVPAGFQVTNSSNASIVAGSDPADMSVTCTLGNAQTQGTMTCQRTGAVVTPVDIALTCPAGQVVAPVITPTPANGTALNCSGQPGSTQTTQVTLQNTGNAAATGVVCSTTGAGFSIQAQPAGTINAGNSATVVAACTAPAEGTTITGTLNCTSGNAGSLSFPLSSAGQAAPVNNNPATIPSTSLWAKIGLIGLLAALGALVVGFRRHN